MYVLAINHQVEDYDRWKAVFDTLPPKDGGASFHRINRDVDNPNVITVVAGWANADDARAFTQNPDLKEAMGRAGVTSSPRFELYEEVEAVQY
jgi:heme-degrading monooxygenase HmoA